MKAFPSTPPPWLSKNVLLITLSPMPSFQIVPPEPFIPALSLNVLLTTVRLPTL